jgi:hypothetical protein
LAIELTKYHDGLCDEAPKHGNSGEARRIAANIAKLPGLLKRPQDFEAHGLKPGRDGEPVRSCDHTTDADVMIRTL